MAEGFALIGDRFNIIEPIGEGGMASVYKAYDTRLERFVAVKVIRKENFTPAALDQVLKRFEREAKSLAQLSHPNIVKVIDFGEFNGAPYLILEYLSGGTLRDHLVTPIPFSLAAQFIIPVTRALSYAHQRNIIHRDIKPSNILLTDSGEPMLSDFGIAKILTGDEIGTLTGSGIIVGTPEYIAPEQGLGNAVDARTDVYALGVVFYEMITARKPFQADTPMGVVIKHISETPLPPHELVPGLTIEEEQTILKALAKDPCNRYQDMASFTMALSGLPSWGNPSQESFFIASRDARTASQSLKPVVVGKEAAKPPSQPALEDTPRIVARVARLEKAIADALAEGDIEDAEGLLVSLENLGEKGQQAAVRFRTQLKQSQANLEKKRQAELAAAVSEVETRLSQGNARQAEESLLKLESTPAAPRAEVDRLRKALEELKQKEARKSQEPETQPELEVVREVSVVPVKKETTKESAKASPPSHGALTRSSLPVAEALPGPGLSKRTIAITGISLVAILAIIAAVVVLPKLFGQLAGGGQSITSTATETHLAVAASTTQAQVVAVAVATKTPRPRLTPTSTLTATQTSTNTSTPIIYQVKIKVDSANIRGGPGGVYPVVIKLNKGDTLVATGRSSQGDWLVLTLPDNRVGWASVTILEFSFDPLLLTVVAAPPTPKVLVTPTIKIIQPTQPPSQPPTEVVPSPEPPTWTPPPLEPTWTPPS